MKNGNPQGRLITRLNSLVFAGVFIIAALVVLVPVYSVRSSSLPIESSRASAGASGKAKQGRTGSLAAFDSTIAGPSSSMFRSFLAVPTDSPETIETLAADCQTPKTTFFLGETVCAAVNFVTENNRFVNWLSPSAGVVFSSPTIPDNQAHFYQYTPTVAGEWKATIADPGDSSIIPSYFTVLNQAAPIVTYAAGCTTPKSSFVLGETVCVKSNTTLDPDRVLYRVQFVDPAVLVEDSVDVTATLQTINFTLPTATSQTMFAGTLDEVTFDNRGTWLVNLANSDDAGVDYSVPITVHDTNPLTKVADLQISKFYTETSQAGAGGTLQSVIWVSNGGPDAAQGVQFTDTTPANTTFYSLTPTAGASFNCVTPSVGSAGTTTCSRTSLVAGESAGFIIVYQVNPNVGSGTVSSSSAMVSSTTTDRNATDNNSSSTATLNNPTPPTCTVTCPDNITVGTNAVNGQNQPGAIVVFDDAETSGTCGTGITSTTPSGSFFPVGPTLVTQTTGSGASCSFTVNVVNVPQPTIACQANQTATAGSASEAAVAVPTPAITGSFTQNQIPEPLTSSRSDQRDVSDLYPIGTTTITWTVTDQYGTMKSCIQTVTVTSADAPTITCPTNRTYAAAAGECQTTLTLGQIGTPTTGGAASPSGEPCPVSNPCATRSDHLALTDPFPAGQTAITWTATNAVGSVSCTEVITITTTGDTTAPVLTIPADISIASSDCSVLLDDELGVATATDSCTPAVNVTRTGLPQIPCPIPGNPGRTCDSFFFPTGTTSILYTATDAAGNTATGVQHVTVTESPAIPPTISAPANLTINTLATDTICGTFVGDATLGSATANDNCPGVTITRTGVPAGNNFPVGDTYITYVATDRSGNTNTTPAVQRVTVVDKTPPVFTSVPPTVTAYTGPGATSCDTIVDNATIGTAAATDNCGTVTVTRSPSGNTFPVGNTTITWTATDSANPANTTTATQTVTVIDNTVPVITVNGSMPSMWPPNHKYQTFQLTGFVTGASDNCGGIGISNVVIEKVTSDETENGNGDGNTNNDIVIAANCKSVQLRSEREGGGNGRVYTITFMVTDTHGNVGRATSKVVVQHNPGETAVDSGVHYTVNGTCP